MTDRSSLTDKLESRRAYWQALGHFIDTFATVEATLQIALWHYAKTPAPIARAIFYGVRVENAMGSIRRIIEVTNPGAKAKADLENIFAQLKIINNVRNGLVHYGAFSTPNSPENMVITNAMVALSKDRVSHVPISVEILSGLIADILKIQMHLVIHHIGWKARNEPLPESLAAAKHQYLNAAWRYKPPRQAPNRRKSRAKSPKR